MFYISKTLRSLTFEILSKTESTLDNKLKEVKKELKKQIKETNDRIDCKEKENSDKFEEIERKFQLTESEKNWEKWIGRDSTEVVEED